jgi:hypothetical protein
VGWKRERAMTAEPTRPAPPVLPLVWLLLLAGKPGTLLCRAPAFRAVAAPMVAYRD